MSLHDNFTSSPYTSHLRSSKRTREFHVFVFTFFSNLVPSILEVVIENSKMDRTKLIRDSMASNVEPLPHHETQDPSRADTGIHSEALNYVVDDRVVNFMTGLYARIHSSSGRTVADLIDLQVQWFDKNTQPPS